MAASEKLTLENFKSLSLGDLEEVAYALQIEYDPPLTEDQRPRILGYIEYIIRSRDEFDEDIIIERRRRKRRLRRKSCDDDKTAIMQKNVGLMSDSQLVFLPQIEIIRDRDGVVVDKKIKYFCLDRYNDLPVAIDNRTNPLNNAPLTEEQLQFLIEQRDNNPYPDIRVDEFLDEIEARIGEYVLPKVSKYILLGDKLEKLLKSQVGDFLSYDLVKIQGFATELTAPQYKKFMRFHKIKIKNKDRNDAAIETLQSLINLYNTRNDYETAVIITLTIGDYMHMIDNKLTFQELVDGGERPGLVWRSIENIKERYYNNGHLKSSIQLNDEGQKHGPYRTYYDNGKDKIKGTYKNNEKDGVWEEFYKNKQLKRHREYKNNKKDGVWEKYDKNRKIEERDPYKNGKKDGFYERFSNGEIVERGTYKNNKKDGVWEEYYLPGLLAEKGTYKEGKKEGVWEFYWDHGNLLLQSRGTYKEGKKEGVWEFYDEDGPLKYKIEYENGSEKYEVYLKSLTGEERNEFVDQIKYYLNTVRTSNSRETKAQIALKLFQFLSSPKSIRFLKDNKKFGTTVLAKLNEMGVDFEDTEYNIEFQMISESIASRMK